MRAARSSVREPVATNAREAEEAPEVAATEKATGPYPVYRRQQLAPLQQVNHQRRHVEDLHETLQRRVRQTVEVAYREQQHPEQWSNQGLQRLPYLWPQQRQWQQPVRQPAGHTQQQQGKPEQTIQQNQGRQQGDKCCLKPQKRPMQQQYKMAVRGTGDPSAGLYSRILDACVSRSSSACPRALRSTASLVIRFKHRRICAAWFLRSPLIFLILPFFLLSSCAGGTEASAGHSCWSLKTQRARPPAERVASMAGFAPGAATYGVHTAGAMQGQAEGSRIAAAVCKSDAETAAATALPRRLTKGSAARELPRAGTTIEERQADGAHGITSATAPASLEVATVGAPRICTAQTQEKAGGTLGRAAERAGGSLVGWSSASELVAAVGTASRRYLAVRGRSSSYASGKGTFCCSLPRSQNSRFFQASPASFSTPLSFTPLLSSLCFPRALTCTIASCVSSALHAFNESCLSLLPSCFCASLRSRPASAFGSTAVRLRAPFSSCSVLFCTISLLCCSSWPSSSCSVFSSSSCTTPTSSYLQLPLTRRHRLRLLAISDIGARPSLPLAHSSRRYTWNLLWCLASCIPLAISIPSRFMSSQSRLVPGRSPSCRTPATLSLFTQYSWLPCFPHFPSGVFAYVSTFSASAAAATPSPPSAVRAPLPPLRSFPYLTSSSALCPCPPSRARCLNSSFGHSSPAYATVSQRVAFTAEPSFHFLIPTFRLQGVSSPSCVGLNRSASFLTMAPLFPTASLPTFRYFSASPRSWFVTASPSLSQFSVFSYGFVRHMLPPGSPVAAQRKFALRVLPVLHQCQQSATLTTAGFGCSLVVCPGTISASAAQREDNVAAGRAAASAYIPTLQRQLNLNSSTVRHCGVVGLVVVGQRREFMSLLQSIRLAPAVATRPSTSERSSISDLAAEPRGLLSYVRHSRKSGAADVFSFLGGKGGERGDEGAKRMTPTTQRDAADKPSTNEKNEAFVGPAEDEEAKNRTAALNAVASVLKDAKENQAARASILLNAETGANASVVKGPTACPIPVHQEEVAAVATDTPSVYRKTILSAKVTEGGNKFPSADGDEAASHLAPTTASASLSGAVEGPSRDQLKCRLNSPLVSRRSIGEQRRLDRRLNWFKQYPYAPEDPAAREKKGKVKTSGVASHGVSASDSFLPVRRLPHSLRWELLAETPAPAAAAAAAAAAATQAAMDVLESSAVSVKQRKSKKRLKKRAAARAAVAAAAAAQTAPGSAALIAAARWLQSTQLQKSSGTEGEMSAGNDTATPNAEVATVPVCTAERESDTSTSQRSTPSPTIAARTAAPPATTIENNARGDESSAEKRIHQLAHGREADNVIKSLEHTGFAEGSLPMKTGAVKQPHFAAGGPAIPAGTSQLTDAARAATEHCPSLLSLLYPSKHAAYPPQLAFFVMKQLGTSKFNESVELHVQLNMGSGPRGKARMSGATVGRVKGYVTLPHGEFGELAQLTRSQQQHRQQEGEQANMQVQHDTDGREEGAMHLRQDHFPLDEGDVGNPQKGPKSAGNAEMPKDQEYQPPPPSSETARAEPQEMSDSVRSEQRQHRQSLGEATRKERSLLSVSRGSIRTLPAGTVLPDAIVKEESGVVRGRKRGGRWRRRSVIAAFVDKADERAAVQAGADIVGADKILSLIRDKAINFDVLISTPDMVARLTRYGKILGPKDLLPQDAWGTLNADFCEAIRLYRQTTVPYKSDKFNIVHMTIGHALMPTAHLVENLEAAIHSLYCCKPPSAGPNFLYKVHISSTMGPGILIDMKHIGVVAGGKQRMQK